MRYTVCLVGMFLAISVPMALAGCEAPADYESLDLVEVTGKVTLDTQPLAGATVRFEGPPGRFSTGQTDAAGVYRLMYDSSQAGCTPGEKVGAHHQTRGGRRGRRSGAIEGADGQVIATQAAEPIPAEYNTASTLAAHVTASTKSFNYDLKSKP